MVITRRTLLAAVLCLAALASSAQEKFITVASTTSTEQSGLFGYLLPISSSRLASRFASWHWVPVRRSTSADAATPTSSSHARAAEEKFLAEGQASNAIR